MPKQIHIGYDVSILEDNRFTGVEKLCFYLFSHLWEQTPQWKHSLFCRSHPKKLNKIPDNTQIVIAKSQNKWRFTSLPKEIKKQHCNLFISPVAAIPVLPRIPIIAYIHECQWLHQTGENISGMHRYALWLAALRAHTLLTNSEFTKQDILRELKPFSAKTEVVSPAGDPFSSAEKEDIESLLSRLCIPKKPYCLFCSTIRRKKNIPLLLEAFSHASLQDLNLICVGKIEDKELVKNKPDNVYFTGYTKQNDLSNLYQNAQAFVYISQHEGFGLPILEAFQYNCPVVASKKGSIPEVGGEAVEYINNFDCEEVVTKIRNVCFDEKKRQQLITKGKEQHSSYSWQNSAKKLEQIIYNILR